LSFSEDIDRALRLLRARGRVSLRAIALELGVDAEYMRSIRDEIVDVLQLAHDDGKGVLTAMSPDVDGLKSLDRTPGAERRLLTFLFCDVVSSTPLSVRLDPEDLRELMLKYQSVCSSAIERFDGHISQWIGDGVFTYFGFPKAHEDDAVRAVHTALAIVEEVSGIPAACDGTKLTVRIGVHTGWSVVGGQGGSSQNQTLAFGEAPNVCARIEACAEPSSILVSESTFALAEGFFAFSDLGEFRLKGVDRQIHLYKVIGSSGAGVRFDVVRDQGLLPLVDRALEREFLSAGWRGGQTGDGPALLIEGEAGIGKSRIVHFVRQLVLKPAQILELLASPYHRRSSLRAVSDALRRFWDLDPLPGGDRLAAIAARLDALQFDEPFALPLLADLLNINRPEHVELMKLAPPQIRSLTFETICKLVLRISETAPLLVIVEDMHWLDPSSSELVRWLLLRRQGSKTFFVMTARPEYMQLSTDLPGVEQLVLEGLPIEDSIELARLAMAGDPNAVDMAERIAARSDGNPLFIEELTRTVPFLGADRSGQQDQIPFTLQSTLRAHLDGVENWAREVAEWGAVIGNRFDRLLLTTASGLDQETISQVSKGLCDHDCYAESRAQRRSGTNSVTPCSRRRLSRVCSAVWHGRDTLPWRTHS
jgi:class 3 adenylate cyclase